MAGLVLDALDAAPRLWLVVAAWLLVFALFPAALRAVVRAGGWTDVGLALGVALAGFVLRVVAPWGPMNFAEAQRVAALWTMQFEPNDEFLSLQLLYALPGLVGVPPSIVYRAWPLVLGSAGVALAFVLARAAGVGRSGAVLAGLVVAAWPQHVRYSASASLAVESAALACATLAVLASEGLGESLRARLGAALLVLTVYARPEMRFVVAAAAVLAAGPGWTRRSRLELAAIAALPLVAYVPVLAVPHTVAERTPFHVLVQEHAQMLLGSPSLAPVWWTVAGVVGLALAPLRVHVRAALGFFALLLLVACTFAGGEHNPLWGNWRYYVEFVPLLAVGAGAWLSSLASARRVLPVAFAVVAAGAVLHWPVVRRPIDLQVQFEFLRETAPTVLAARTPVVLTNRVPVAGMPFIDNLEDLSLFPVGLLRRLPERAPATCAPDADPKDAPAAVALAERPPPCVERGRAAVFLGTFGQHLRERAFPSLVPLVERRAEAALFAPQQDVQCASPPGISGMSLPGCALLLGWYEWPADAPQPDGAR